MENKETNGFFPLYVDLSEKQIVVIGAGTIASRRIETLVPFCNHITVIAPTISDKVKQLEEQGCVKVMTRAYEREDLYGADLVLAATDDHKLNDGIYSVCKCLGILVNVCSNQHKCDFQFPGIVRQDNVVVGINAAGTDHKKVKKIRECIEEAFDRGDLG